MLEVRHIQDHNAPNTTIWTYFGYPDRIVPCQNDAGTCEYLDAVYWMHSTSMLYTYILWIVLASVLAALLAFRTYTAVNRSSEIRTPFHRGFGTIQTFSRRYLLPETGYKWLFGRVTRLQVVILACLLAYLLVFSLIGIVYKTWVTPVKKHPGVYNTRTGLGGFADRVGALAYALTPFTVALASRESVLSLITGVPYQHFNFLHRWTGRVIFVQSFLHTLGWTIVEAKLYQPQPSVYKSFMAEQYIIFGVVAMFFVTVLTIFSTKRAIEWTGYEVFRKVHYLVALLYIGACWGHWDKLSFWMYASLILFFLDRFARLIRTALLHFGFRKGENGIGFRSATATVQHLGDDDDSLVRLDFDFKHGPWRAGQHFYLCFPALSVWQSHPLTPSSLPVEGEVQHHTYLIRTRKGMTAELAALAKAGDGSSTTTPVILTGPYGRAFSDNAEKNVLAVAGGTGITFTLPVLLDILARPVRMTRAIDFTWIVRSTQDLLWLAPELSSLKARIASQETPNLRLRIFVTREASSSVTPSSAEKVKDVPAVTVSCARDSEKAARSSAAGLSLSLGDLVASVPGFEVMYLGGRHPSIENLVAEFEERADVAGGASQVVGSGPEAIGTELRDAAAKRNRPGKVWEGDEEGSMGMYWDSRE